MHHSCHMRDTLQSSLRNTPATVQMLLVLSTTSTQLYSRSLLTSLAHFAAAAQLVVLWCGVLWCVVSLDTAATRCTLSGTVHGDMRHHLGAEREGDRSRYRQGGGDTRSRGAQHDALEAYVRCVRVYVWREARVIAGSGSKVIELM